MKHLLRRLIGPADKSLVVVFGSARLLRDRAGTFELHGGTARDRSALRDWISLFQHEVACGTGLRRGGFPRPVPTPEARPQFGSPAGPPKQPEFRKRPAGGDKLP